jgi:hypothetical protein
MEYTRLASLHENRSAPPIAYLCLYRWPPYVYKVQPLHGILLGLLRREMGVPVAGHGSGRAAAVVYHSAGSGVDPACTLPPRWACGSSH